MTNPTKKQFNDEQESDLRKANSVKSDGFNYSLTKEGNIAMEKPKICPHCKMEIEHLDFDVTATCSAQIYKEDLDRVNPVEYDIDCLTSNAQFDNFRCPECSENIGKGSYDEAKEFLSCEENLICERCHKKDKSTRFEGLTESNICDRCLAEFKDHERRGEI